jgi:polysaccharide biosynthesis transport protein
MDHVQSVKEIDLLDVLRSLRRHIWLICAIVLVGMLLSAVFILHLPKQYSAEASLVLNSRISKIADLQSFMSKPLMGVPASDTSVIRTEMDTITSPALIELVIREKHLLEEPEFNPLLKKEGPSLMQRVLDAFGVTSPPPAEQDPMPLTLATVRQQLAVLNDGVSYVLTIRFTAHDPALAAEVANAFAEIYLREQQNVKLATTRSAATWLRGRIHDLEGEVTKSEREFLSFREQHHLTESNGGTLLDQQISELNTQLISAAADRTKAEANLRELQHLLQNPRAVDGASSVLMSPLIQRLREEEARLQDRAAELENRFLDGYPALSNAHAQVQEIRREIQSETRKIIEAQTNDYVAAKQREAQLKDQLTALEQRRTDMTGPELQLRALERVANANRSLYVSYLEKYKEISAQEHSQEPDARLLAPAQVPLHPSSHSRTMLLGSATLAWFGLAVTVCLLLGWLRSGFNNLESLEAYGQVRSFGLIPDVGRRSRPVDLLVADPNSRYPEAVKSVYASLQCNGDVDAQVLLVTSALPGEGKSVFAASLARSIALAGKKTLLVDCDLRRPAVAKFFEESNAREFSTCFSTSRDFSELTARDTATGLDYIAARREPNGIHALLNSPQLRAIVREARAHYDHIVIDTPPLLAVSDALLLSNIADAVLLVVRWEHTPRAIVQHVLKMVRDNNVPLAGVLLTRVNMRKHARYNYGDSAYFHTRHAGYYG